ncbi:hypothetical protein JCM24511_00253 [Saitozyma sp. JCM 24511]|nr:hypothetical protein JCM24511_00253 [Saitozyma sp. JCM 24511]
MSELIELGYDETLRYIHDFMVKNPPFDEKGSTLKKQGIMGFSQGGCMAAILAALLEKPGLSPYWPSEPPLPKFKCTCHRHPLPSNRLSYSCPYSTAEPDSVLIAVGGFLPSPTTPSFEDYFPLPASLPTLHVVGRNDTLVTLERSQTLVDRCDNARVEIHEGGHFTPSKASWRHFFK